MVLVDLDYLQDYSYEIELEEQDDFNILRISILEVDSNVKVIDSIVVD